MVINILQATAALFGAIILSVTLAGKPALGQLGFPVGDCHVLRASGSMGGSRHCNMPYLDFTLSCPGFLPDPWGEGHISKVPRPCNRWALYTSRVCTCQFGRPLCLPPLVIDNHSYHPR